MSALVVDTSSWIAYFAGAARPAIEEALEEGRAWLPAVVAAELLSGRLTARQRRRLTSLLDDLPLAPFDRGHWVRVGSLRAFLRGKGVAVSTPDAHVAQCALDLGAELLTEDRVFRLVASHTDLRLAATSGP